MYRVATWSLWERVQVPKYEVSPITLIAIRLIYEPCRISAYFAHLGYRPAIAKRLKVQGWYEVGSGLV